MMIARLHSKEMVGGFKALAKTITFIGALCLVLIMPVRT